MSQPLALSIEQDTDVITNLEVDSTALPTSKPSLLRDAPFGQRSKSTL
jgi:hypothetical protein